MTRLRLTHLAPLLAAGALAGCSPVEDFTNSPDAAIDAADTAGPGIVSSNPAHMGTKFSVIQPITVTFDEDVDPATVTAATVTLTQRQSQYVPLYPNNPIAGPSGPIAQPVTPIRGTVAFDAVARKLTFTPAQPLAYSGHYTLTLTDIKDAYGNATSSTIAFRTYVNATIREVHFSNNGNLSYYDGYPTDVNGLRERWVQYYSVGADTLWFTSDDLAGINIRFRYDDNGDLADEYNFGPGPDNLYNTADDVPVAYFSYAQDAQMQPTERTYHTSAGPDAMWGTADDPIALLFSYSIAAGRTEGYVYFNNAGTDGMWRTADDRCTLYFQYEYDADGRKTRDIQRSCGADQLPRTADDTFQQVRDYTYDSNGALTHTGIRNGPGPDGMWLTADDSHSSIVRQDRDDSGQLTQTFTYSGAGPDTLWGTADDVINGHSRVTYDEATRLPILVVTYSSSGADSMWGTADDVVSSYTRTSYNGSGNRVDAKRYAIGADGVWFTADDRVLNDVDYNISQ
jgi:hypothetical protein